MAMTIQPTSATEIIGTAFSLIGQRCNGDSRALAAIAGLRLIRSTIAEHAGYGATCQLDEWLAATVARARRNLNRKLPVVPLPASTEASYGADLIARDAVLSCFFLNGEADDNNLILAAADALVEALTGALGGPPPWDALFTKLQEEEPAGTLESGAGHRMIMLQ
jgi:hypothetical protein